MKPVLRRVVLPMLVLIVPLAGCGLSELCINVGAANCPSGGARSGNSHDSPSEKEPAHD